MKSKGMLTTKSFKLDKPKKGDGWAKILEWNRRWNKILSVIFGILSFSLLFAIVLANILHADYKNYELVTTTTSSTTSASTSTTDEPVTVPTTEDYISTSTSEETPSTTTMELATTTQIATTMQNPTTTQIATTTPMYPQADSTTVLFTTTHTTPTVTTDLYPTGPPVVVTTRSVPLFTTTADYTPGTSSAILPESNCTTTTCTVGYCVLAIYKCSLTCTNGDGSASYTSDIIDTLTKVCSQIFHKHPLLYLFC